MKQIQVKLIVVSLLIIAISLAVIAFKPIIEDIQYSIWRRSIRSRQYRQPHEKDIIEPRLQQEEDIVDQWLEKQR